MGTDKKFSLAPSHRSIAITVDKKLSCLRETAPRSVLTTVISSYIEVIRNDTA